MKLSCMLLYKFLLCFVLLTIIAGMRATAQAQADTGVPVMMSAAVSATTYPKSPEPWRNEYNISLDGFQFSHPITVVNQAELDIIKQRITDRIEPQYSAYQALMSEAQEQLNFKSNAPASLRIPGGYVDNEGLLYARGVLWEHSHAIYTCALAYALTNESQYARKAKEILMDWANTGTRFTDDDRGLQLGSYFSPMLYAADLIHSYTGWSSSERTTFKNWWRVEVLDRGDVLDVMRRKNNNWKDAGLLGTFAASVVLEDKALLQEALIQLTSYFYNRTDKYVPCSSGTSWKIRKDSRGVYLPREVVRNDGRSGLTYTAYTLTTMVQCFEIARYAGFNYWNKSTEEGATLKDVIVQYYDWDIRDESFPWNSNPKKTLSRRNAYELANSRYSLSNEMKNWVVNARELNGAQGDEYCTLTKGDMTVTSTLLWSR